MSRHAPTRRSNRVARAAGQAARWSGLCLAVAALVLGVLSFVRFDGLEYRTGTIVPPDATNPDYRYNLRTTSLLNANAAISISWWNYPSKARREEDLRSWRTMEGLEHARLAPGDVNRRGWFSVEAWGHWRFAGLGHEKFTMGATHVNAVQIPHWLPILMGLAPWIPFAIRQRGVLRRRAGHCATCGYDRAGLAPERACPECGRSQTAT